MKQLICWVKKQVSRFWKWLKPYCTWRMLPLFLLAWMITNGWCYIFIIIGPMIDARWMTVTGTTYAAFLWAPFTPEKIVTITIASGLYRLIYKEKFELKKEIEYEKDKETNNNL